MGLIVTCRFNQSAGFISPHKSLTVWYLFPLPGTTNCFALPLCSKTVIQKSRLDIPWHSHNYIQTLMSLMMKYFIPLYQALIQFMGYILHTILLSANLWSPGNLSNIYIYRILQERATLGHIQEDQEWTSLVISRKTKSVLPWSYLVQN